MEIILFTGCLVTAMVSFWIVATTPPEVTPEPLATLDEMRNI